MPGMTTVDVCIRGSGAVGLALALALARQGLRVGLTGAAPVAPGAHDRTDDRTDVRTDVRTYALNAASRALLVELKVWAALPADAVTPVDDMHIEGDAAGRAAGGSLDFSAWSQGSEALAWALMAAASGGAALGAAPAESSVSWSLVLRLTLAELLAAFALFFWAWRAAFCFSLNSAGVFGLGMRCGCSSVQLPSASALSSSRKI